MSTLVPDHLVYVVDDDASVRGALQDLFEASRLRSVTFDSPAAFLDAPHPDVPSCLVLDVRFPGHNGLDLQQQLAEVDVHIPIIFITAHGDVPMASRALRAGAVEFLLKPFRKDTLLAAVGQGIECHRAWRLADHYRAGVRARFAMLTGREREVLGLVTRGLANKQVAALLGLTEITIKVHRGNVMRKMQADSLADLVRMADTVLPPTASYTKA